MGMGHSGAGLLARVLVWALDKFKPITDGVAPWLLWTQQQNNPSLRLPAMAMQLASREPRAENNNVRHGLCGKQMDKMQLADQHVMCMATAA